MQLQLGVYNNAVESTSMLDRAWYVRLGDGTWAELGKTLDALSLQGYLRLRVLGALRTQRVK